MLASVVVSISVKPVGSIASLLAAMAGLNACLRKKQAVHLDVAVHALK